MGRDMRDSSREQARYDQTGERGGYNRPAPPRASRSGAPREATPPPSRYAGTGENSRAGRGAPSDPGSRRPGGNGFIKRPGPADDAYGGPAAGPSRDSRESRSAYASGARGSRYDSRSNETPRRSRSGEDYSGYEPTAERSGGERGGRGRSMASLARDASRSMSRQLSVMMSRTARAVRDAGDPRPRQVTPPPRPRISLPPELEQKLADSAVPPYKRSRTRMLARKWRLSRVPPNPLLYIGGILGFAVLALVVVFAGGAGGVYAVNYYQYHLADIQAIANLKAQASSEIFDRNGVPLYTVHNDQGFNYYVPLSQISEKLQWATIDTEDHTFYSNMGIDWAATGRALLIDAAHGGAADQGASSITQQLVKNIVLHDTTKALQRKINEAILAIGVTQQYTKGQVLEMYLNTIPYGDQNEGIEAAARNFFGLTPKQLPDGTLETANQQLSWAQAALLAGLPNAPTLYLPLQYSCSKAPCQQSQWYDPYVSGQECVTFRPDIDAEWYLTQGHEWLDYCRAMTVLEAVQAWGMPGSSGQLTDADMTQAKSDLINMLTNETVYHWAGRGNGSATNGTTKLAPHFVDYVVEQLADYWGISDLETGGYKIYTTLDYSLQKYAEQDLHHYIDENYTEPFYPVNGVANPWPPLSDPNNANAHNGALVAMDQRNGDILAMVGSVDYNSKDPHVLGSNNITTSKLRSMGSSTKPIIYATAFQMGWTPGIMLQDIPICHPVSSVDPTTNQPTVDASAPACKGYYVPHDYEEDNFSGTFPIRRQLDDSLNIAATEAISFVGDRPDSSQDLLSMAQRLGITTLKADAMGPTTVLGTQDIPLLQLTGAYATFANLGKRAEPRSILRIVDANGNVVYPTPQTPKDPPTTQVISPEAAYMITNILTDNLARTPFFKEENPLTLWPDYSNFAIAGKTGTSSGSTGPLDIVTMGYSPYMTLGVWVGNTDGNDPLTPGVIGVTGAGYIFHDVMVWALKNFHWPTDAQFQVPPDIVQGSFNCSTGLAPYKGADSKSLNCPFTPFAPKTSSNPYNTDHYNPGLPDTDIYIQGQAPVQS